MTDAQLRTLRELDWRLSDVTRLRGVLRGPALTVLYRSLLTGFGDLLEQQEVAA